MKTRYIHDITAISLLLSFCSCEQEYNVTFHEGKTTWIDATKHCYDNDEVLYNNKDDIKNLLTNISVEVWAGQYTALSPWTVTWDNITNMKNVAKSCKDETKCLCIYAVCTDKGISLTPGNCGLEFIVKCELPNLLPSFRCLKLTKQADSEVYDACDKQNVVLPFFCKLGMIIGIVISISVLVLTILVILAFMYRRTYAKENASFNTAGREDLNTNDIDNNTVISDYQQLDDVDDVQKKTNAYDQLSVTHSNGINTNTVISDYEELHKSDKDTSTQAYDQLNVTREFKTEPTIFFSKITASTEKHSKTESTKATAATSEFEQLDNAKKDKSVNVYDQLHVTDIIDNEQTNYNSMTTKPRDQQSNAKPTEETTKLNKRTVTSEYEHLDNATKDTSVNVYDNLNDSGVMDNDPTHHNPCQ
ncbi:unnamed protein product [Mytilus edulis]|uniref:C-type lectin domain-containing protein n=1 Tax=Mytilus edulis TaxID=6550 RepID=A0A8S3UWD7_MYTED|nr:unnamed protein product [Mytilus edulis]